MTARAVADAPARQSIAPPVLIAVVDDDQSVRLSTSHFLKQAGYVVRSFESGDAFLSIPIPQSFACVLLDMNMPGTDGLAVLLALYERGEAPPIIVVTGHGNMSLAKRAIDLGALDFIEKPYKPADLKAAIDNAVARWRAAIGERTESPDTEACGRGTTS